MFLLTDGDDVMFALGWGSRTEGHAGKWCAGAISGQTLGHQTGHQCCHHSTEGWPGMYTDTANMSFMEKSSTNKYFPHTAKYYPGLRWQIAHHTSIRSRRLSRWSVWSVVCQSVNERVKTCVVQIIMAKAAGGPRAPQQRGHWDKDSWEDEPENFETHH